MKQQVPYERTVIAARLREARTMAGLSQGQVSKRLGVTRPVITGMETGNRRVTADELKTLASMYDVTVSWLVGEAPEIVDSSDPRVQLAARELGKLSPEDLNRMLRLLAAVKEEVT